jgi:hypothetical protein
MWSGSVERSLYFSFSEVAEKGPDPGSSAIEVGFQLLYETETFFCRAISICKPRKTSDGVATLKVPTRVLSEIKYFSGSLKNNNKITIFKLPEPIFHKLDRSDSLLRQTD